VARAHAPSGVAALVPRARGGRGGVSHFGEEEEGCLVMAATPQLASGFSPQEASYGW